LASTSSSLTSLSPTGCQETVAYAKTKKISNPKKEMQDACPGSVLQLWN